MADIPASPADGNVKVVLVSAIANTDAPTVAEVTAVGSVDISCYLTASGLTPSLSEQVIADERLCSTQTFEKKGRSQRTLEVEYIDNTNTPDEDLYNLAKDTLVPGSKQFLVIRRGKAFDGALVATDKVTVYPIEPGEYNELPPEANSVLKIGQKLFVTGETKVSVAVAA